MQLGNFNIYHATFVSFALNIHWKYGMGSGGFKIHLCGTHMTVVRACYEEIDGLFRIIDNLFCQIFNVDTFIDVFSYL